MAADDVEWRFMVPREHFDVFDAVCKARRLPRNKVGPEILAKWVGEIIHQANLVQRLTRGNAVESQSDWGELGD